MELQETQLLEEKYRRLKQKLLDQSEKEDGWRPMIWFLTVFAFLWIVNGMGFFMMDEDTRGSFGDFFGVSNALFSGLALSSVAYSLWMQKKELQLQREVNLLSLHEIEESRKSQEESEKALKQQIDMMQKQIVIDALINQSKHWQTIYSTEAVLAGYNKISPDKKEKLNEAFIKMDELVHRIRTYT